MKRFYLGEDLVFYLLLGGIALALYSYYFLWQVLVWVWRWGQSSL